MGVFYSMGCMYGCMYVSNSLLHLCYSCKYPHCSEHLQAEIYEKAGIQHADIRRPAGGPKVASFGILLIPLYSLSIIIAAPIAW